MTKAAAAAAAAAVATVAVLRPVAKRVSTEGDFFTFPLPM